VDANAPFAAGSISLRLYPHLDRDAPAIVDELLAQAALARAHGFDGVMTSEHHGGIAGYLPNPLQLAGFMLDAMPDGWAAACPLLVTLRPAALVAEETAWLAARHPNRVGLGVAAGALDTDFAVMDLDRNDLTARFATALTTVARALRGDAEGVLAGDAALARCRAHPVPVLSAAASRTAARRAARAGVGILLDSLVTPSRAHELADAYRDAGGDGSCVLVRRVWLGAPPTAEFARQTDVYRTVATASATARWGADELVAHADATELAACLAAVADASGADALNIRVHVPGIDPVLAREQIEALGAGVLAPLREALRAPRVR
jgi:alkanesulfonate monooxygenase SsuD/methylene tetrahydromethanopterin reductase-like flavin-dependent oxidoreductase (luciferase family)